MSSLHQYLYIFFSFKKNSPLPSYPSRGDRAPPGGVFELIDRFWSNLAQVVLTYVEIDWHCKNFDYSPSPPGGLFELIDRFLWNLAQMVLTYVGITWHYKNSNSSHLPIPPGGLFELIDRFWLNLEQMVLTYVSIDWHHKNSNSPPKYQYILWLNSTFGHILNAHASCSFVDET